MDTNIEEPHYDISINEYDIINGAKEIVKRIRPSWPNDQLLHKVNFKDNPHKVNKLCYKTSYIYFFKYRRYFIKHATDQNFYFRYLLMESQIN